MAVRLVVRHPNAADGADELSFEFEQARIVIGRGAGADVQLPSLAVSETHATIERQGGRYLLRDERSLNGTSVNGAPLVAGRPRALGTGDELAIAEFTLQFFERPLATALTTPERTASLARRMLRELLGSESALSAPPFLRVVAGPDTGTLVNLGEPPSRLVVGRGEEAGLVLHDLDVSREHLEVARELDGCIARDLASKNGLDVNGKRLRERRLRHGDLLRLGATSLLYQDPCEQTLRGLEKQPAEPLTRTEPRRTQPSEPAAQPASAEVAALPEPAPEPESDRPASPIDYLVYALAAFVLLASVAGLLWLFS